MAEVGKRAGLLAGPGNRLLATQSYLLIEDVQGPLDVLDILID